MPIGVMIMADSIEDMLTGIETLLDVNASQLMEIQELGIASKFANYTNSFYALFRHDTSVATTTSDAGNLVKSSLDLWTEIYDWFSKQSQYSNEDIFSTENQAKIKGLGIVSNVLGLMSSVIAASDKLEEKQWYDIVADYIDSGKDIFSIVESCYTYNDSPVAKLSTDGLYSPLGLYGAIAKAGVSSVSQLVRSIGKYSADGEWNLGDTADTLIDFATAGLYEITHYVTLGLDEVIYSAIFKAAGVNGEVNYAEEIAEGFKNVGDTIGIAIGNFIANIILKKMPQDIVTYKAYGNSLLIQGSTKSDLIYDDHINDTILGGTGVDTIGVFGRNSTIYGEGGNDIIVVASKSNEIYGDLGNDLVIIGQDTASLNKVFGGDGDDEFQVKSDHNTINGGFGDDTIIIEGTADNTVFGGEDNDSIRINDNAINNTVIGGTGDDTISISSAARVWVGYTKGDDNDTIVGFNEDDTLKVSVNYTTDTIGNDVIVYVDNNTITLKDFAGKTLNDNSFQPYDFSDLIKGIIPVNGSDITGEGNTTEDVKIISGDSITNDSDGVILNAQGSSTTIRNSGDDVKINGSPSNDEILNGGYKNSSENWTEAYVTGGNRVTIEGDAGNDIIDNYRGSNIMIDGGADSDRIYNSGINNTIDGGDGDDTITNYAYEVNITSVTINGGTGDDSIYSSGNQVRIDGGYGNDSVSNSGNNVTINGDDNDDYVYNSSLGGYVVASGGVGNDTIYNYSSNVTINGDEGDDSIETGELYIHSTNQVSNVIIDGGAGNDSIRVVYGTDVMINAGDGNDSISLISPNEEFITINGGSGNDTIDTHGSHHTFQYAKGDGNDIIHYTSYSAVYSNEDTLIIYDSNYSTIANGTDVIVQVGDGSITLKNFVDFVDRTMNIITIGDSNNMPVSCEPIQKTGDAYDYTGGDKVISDYSSGNKVKYNTDFTGLDVNGNDLVINSSSGSLKLENVRNEVIDITDNDENTIAYAYLANYEGVVDGSGFDTFEVIAASEEVPNHLISGNGGSSLISGGSNDILQGGAGQDTFIYNKGNDIVANYQDREVINFAASYTDFGFDDNNFFLNAMEGSLTIQNHKDKWIDIAGVDGNIIAHAYVANEGGVIDGRNFNEVEVLVGGNNANDTIYAGNGGSSLWGGSGDNFDTIIGGSGGDVFWYGKNDGFDHVVNASENDLINLYDVNLSDVIDATWLDSGVSSTSETVFEMAIATNTGRILAVSCSSTLSPTFQLADGSRWQFNRNTTSWQSA